MSTYVGKASAFRSKSTRVRFIETVEIIDQTRAQIEAVEILLAEPMSASRRNAYRTRLAALKAHLAGWEDYLYAKGGVAREQGERVYRERRATEGAA
jgi:hypothetical protein